MTNYKFSAKEKEFLNVFIPQQNFDDSAEGARSFEEMLNEVALTENQLKGVLSSLQSKGVIHTERQKNMFSNNPVVSFIFINGFLYEDNREEMIKEVIKQSGSTNEDYQ